MQANNGRFLEGRFRHFWN